MVAVGRSARLLGICLGALIGLVTWQKVRVDANEMTPNAVLPLVVNTWPFTAATKRAWEVLVDEDGSPMDALERGCNVCEERGCSDSIGYGGHPDEQGETTLDAMVMDGETRRIGGVTSLRRVKHAISVARSVLEHSEHSLLAGDLATEFAKEMGFTIETLTTNDSRATWTNWKERNCQPNFRVNVTPDPTTSCGPYRPMNVTKRKTDNRPATGPDNHDTIGMIVIGSDASVVAGTTTNGLQFKIPGRVADSPIAGAGAYCTKEVGAAVATGDGDVMMLFLPSYQAVESMRLGATPTTAAIDAIERIIPYFPTFSGAVIAANITGEYGAACYGMDTFTFSVRRPTESNVTTATVPCQKGPHVETL